MAAMLELENKQQYGYGVVSKQRHDHEGVSKQQHDHVVVFCCCLIYQNVENCSCGQEEKISSTVPGNLQ